MLNQRNSWITVKFGIILLAAAICFIPYAFPQGKFVPFVGCESHDQVASYAAPKGPEKEIQTPAIAAKKLAYYKTEITAGVLAPRDWHCYGALGSSSSDFLVTPQPIDNSEIFDSILSRNTGPGIQVREICSDNSGRLDIARAIARAFPKQRAFAQNIFQGYDPPTNHYPFGPYPKDKLIRRNDWIVEYLTPHGSEGLGTINLLPIGKLPIRGVAILRNQSPDCLLFLAVRLPPDMADLAPQIIQQIEQENGERAKP
jgi:hypothetical protein